MFATYGPVAWMVVGLYMVLLFLLACYGAHRWYMVRLYWRHRNDGAEPARRFRRLPRLTIQLPLYNELHVARRLIDAVCDLDYPRDRLEIQVLDDSTDETRDLVADIVAEKQLDGHDIVQLHRSDRVGYKAGALNAGLRVASGELIAVFDADFVPHADFARRLVDHFTDETVGMVQARWGHLNPGHSALTRVQSMLLDGHFMIEHTARNRSGRFFNFNGTAGIWRRSAIVDAGGWQHDTLTEDLDLSYRAQMRGWKFVYLPDAIAPAELPIEMGAFKSQQHRWAKGSTQTARKLLPTLLRSTLPLRVKLEAVVHLTANVGYVLMIGLALLVVPSVWIRQEISPWMVLLVDLPIFALSSLSVVAFYLVAHREATGSLARTLRWVPFLMALGIGLSINNGRAVLGGVFGSDLEFKRTPKYNLGSGQRLGSRRYRARVTTDTWIELGLALYFTVATTATAAAGMWGAIPFLMLFQFGYGYTAISSLLQASVRPMAERRSAQSTR